MQSDIGLIGLAVMGQNLALNIADHGFAISVYNRTTAKTDEFIKENPKTPGKLSGYPSIKDFAASLKKPRKAVILVKAGAPTDAVINELAAVFEPGDIIIDGGNALWTDTIRREKELKAKGLRFIGSGVSGGEEGARFGPSLMPGGDPAAWAELKPIWEAVASKVDAVTGVELTGGKPGQPIKGGVPCVTHIGPDGAGHYVKMVHNGIEYGDMQMICEAYDLMRGLLGMTPDEIGTTFEEWNQGDLNSFLIEITAKALRGPKRAMTKPDRAKIIEQIRDALYCSKICSYAQGFQLMREAQNEYKWKLHFGEIAKIWRGGCIIRARFLQKITEAFEKKPRLANLLLDPYFKKTVKKAQKNWRKVIALAVKHGIPVPTLGSALSYFDSYRTESLPQNLLQGQRDYFGAHTYERTDKPRGEFFHIDWPDPKRPQIKA